MMKFKSILFYFSIVLLIALLLFTLIFSFRFYKYTTSPFHLPETKTTETTTTKPTIVTIIVQPGAEIPDLMHSLQQQHLLPHPYYFHLLALLKRANLHLHTGEYLITNKMTPLQLLRNIMSGHVYMRKITLIEGWRFSQIRALLNKNPYIKHHTQKLSDQEVMTELSSPIKNPEGLFFPDTYFYTWGNTDQLILKMSYQQMQRTIQKAWGQRQAGLPYKDSYEALIVASMIERETAVAQERPIIAGVILNRLQKKMRLQIDPTVSYGLNKSFGTVILRSDLSNKNPYNTYQNAGLPPTPIAMPGLASILAALHPQKSDYLFYVSDGHGHHQFSTTFSEHLKAVANYRKQQNQKKEEGI